MFHCFSRSFIFNIVDCPSAQPLNWPLQILPASGFWKRLPEKSSWKHQNFFFLFEPIHISYSIFNHLQSSESKNFKNLKALKTLFIFFYFSYLLVISKAKHFFIFQNMKQAVNNSNMFMIRFIFSLTSSIVAWTKKKIKSVAFQTRKCSIRSFSASAYFFIVSRNLIYGFSHSSTLRYFQFLFFCLVFFSSLIWRQQAAFKVF